MPQLSSVLLLAVLAVNIPARAQHMNEKDSPCANVVLTVELANCFAKARDAVDTQLNAIYKSVRETLDAGDIQPLVSTQRLWIQYRDANCSAERGLYAGGTAASPAYLACLEAMTRARIKELAVTYGVKLK
ncbi:MAG TPA: lysozyme inhibitor LprI family protein [Bryobacteraceae bacterium]|nr:lysozyme inhibitor LprI family protein [Bryobacteraceae bacterium]